MADLKSLFAKAKANDESGTGIAERPSVAAESPTVLPAQAESESVSRADNEPQADVSKPKNPFAVGRKPSGSGESNPVDSGSTGDSSESRPSLAGVFASAKSSSGTVPDSLLPVGNIDSLDDLDSLEEQGIEPRRSVSGFEDETPATAPTRELPEDISKEELGFIQMIDGVYEVLHEPDLLGSVIRNIMIELANNREYMRLVAPEDIRSWVRGMRDSMGLARIKKTEAKAKRAGGSGKKSKLVDDDMLADLASLGITE
jgi:hypothetical protein